MEMRERTRKLPKISKSLCMAALKLWRKRRNKGAFSPARRCAGVQWSRGTSTISFIDIGTSSKDKITDIEASFCSMIVSINFTSNRNNEKKEKRASDHCLFNQQTTILFKWQRDKSVHGKNLCSLSHWNQWTGAQCALFSNFDHCQMLNFPWKVHLKSSVSKKNSRQDEIFVSERRLFSEWRRWREREDLYLLQSDTDHKQMLIYSSLAWERLLLNRIVVLWSVVCLDARPTFRHEAVSWPLSSQLFAPSFQQFHCSPKPSSIELR